MGDKSISRIPKKKKGIKKALRVVRNAELAKSSIRDEFNEAIIIIA